MSKIQPTDGQLTIIDGEGNEKLCQILFTLDSEEFGKKYVVFYPLESMEEDDSEQIELMAAIYTEGEDGTGELSQVETDEEWAMLEEAVGQYEDEMDEDGHCCCEHDECDHDECEEDDDDDDCCCHHHHHHEHHHHE